jgi:hypothetical protein
MEHLLSSMCENEFNPQYYKKKKKSELLGYTLYDSSYQKLENK